jgi:hypothetical protein
MAAVAAGRRLDPGIIIFLLSVVGRFAGEIMLIPGLFVPRVTSGVIDKDPAWNIPATACG